MEQNPEKYYAMDEYTSRVTPQLQIVGTEDKEQFTKNFLENQELRSKYKLLGTHSETFHCDEVMATALLQYTKEYENSIIVRTRDQTILDQLDCQCDVGGIYDSEKRRFDHHQKTFTSHWWQESDAKKLEEMIKAGEEETKIQEFKQHMEKPLTKMSSAGLIYKHYGREIITTMVKQFYDKDIKQDELELAYEKLYKLLIMEVDAVDNGVNQADDLKYHINSSLGGRVAHQNSPWNAPSSVTQHVQFKKAMKICEEAFIYKLYGQIMILFPARNLVKEAWDARTEFHPSGEFIYYPTTCPWKDHMFNLEYDNGVKGLIKFAFFQDGRTMWRVMAIPAKAGGFDNRVSLCKSYRGLRGEELQKATGCSDAEFCHMAGFIGGAWSRESAIKMAEASLKEHNDAIVGDLDLEKKQKLV